MERPSTLDRRRTVRVLAAVLLAAWFAPSHLAGTEPEEPVRVVVTLGVLADVARGVGGEHVVVDVLSDPRQDLHYVEPRPTLTKRARDADLFVEIGLQLELWADQVIQSSGNPRIQKGLPGRCVASTNVGALERPTVLSREMGDVHPDGNPHIWLDPLNVRVMAENVHASLVAVDPMNAAAYDDNLARYLSALDEALFGVELLDEVGSAKLVRLARQDRLHEWLERRGLLGRLGGWLARAEPLRGRQIVTYHKNWSYLAERFGFEVPIEVESKAGVPPSARHRDRVLELVRTRAIPVILQAAFYDTSVSRFLAEGSGARVVSLPVDCGEAVGYSSYIALMDGILGHLVDALE